jgi:hypothetical protein
LLLANLPVRDLDHSTEACPRTIKKMRPGVSERKPLHPSFSKRARVRRRPATLVCALRAFLFGAGRHPRDWFIRHSKSESLGPSSGWLAERSREFKLSRPGDLLFKKRGRTKEAQQDASRVDLTELLRENVSLRWSLGAERRKPRPVIALTSRPCVHSRSAHNRKRKFQAMYQQRARSEIRTAGILIAGLALGRPRASSGLQVLVFALNGSLSPAAARLLNGSSSSFTATAVTDRNSVLRS